MNASMDELRSALEKDPNLSAEERHALVEYLDNYVPRHERLSVPRPEQSEIEADVTLEEEVLQYLEEKLIGFESAHPDLTHVIQKMSAVLANMGI